MKIERAAGPEGGSAGRRRRSGTDGSGFDRRKRTIQIKYRGGAEAYWLLDDGRGPLMIPGHVCLHDALSELLGLELPK